MRPLFTIHGGEWFVGDYIEREYKSVHVWVPAKDTGVDLLVSDSKNKQVVSLQVKYSQDYLATFMKNIKLKESLHTWGWWKFNRRQIAASPAADYWILVVIPMEKPPDFVIIKPADLLRRLDTIHQGKPKSFQSDFWVTKKRECWETRALAASDKSLIVQGEFRNDERDFSAYLDNWGPIKELNELNR
jgi:hypothetical protein